MRWKIVSCICLVAFVGASCDIDDDGSEAAPSVSAPALAPDAFALTGVVIDAKQGAQPPGGIPGEDDMMAATVGGIAIRPDTDDVIDTVGLDGCAMTQDAYVTYYTPETDAAGLEDDDVWPETLEGRNVTVEGTRHDPADVDASPDASPKPSPTDADDCVLVVDTIRPASASMPAPADGAGTDTDQTTNDDGGAAGGSPRPTDEGEWVWPPPADFPEHEDTDPIFEGTPSPDPCEGAKACAEKREEEEARESPRD